MAVTGTAARYAAQLSGWPAWTIFWRFKALALARRGKPRRPRPPPSLTPSVTMLHRPPRSGRSRRPAHCMKLASGSSCSSGCGLHVCAQPDGFAAGAPSRGHRLTAAPDANRHRLFHQGDVCASTPRPPSPSAFCHIAALRGPTGDTTMGDGAPTLRDVQLRSASGARIAVGPLLPGAICA
jgi:hypothetical protein